MAKKNRQKSQASAVMAAIAKAAWLRRHAEERPLDQTRQDGTAVGVDVKAASGKSLAGQPGSRWHRMPSKTLCALPAKPGQTI